MSTVTGPLEPPGSVVKATNPYDHVAGSGRRPLLMRLTRTNRPWTILGPLLTIAAVAILVSLAAAGVRVPNPPAIMVLVIVATAFMGGLAPGVVSALISWTYVAL